MKNQRSVQFRFLAEPSDVNFGGNVHGGAVMKWIDQADYACGSLWSGTYCVTAYVGGIRFIDPIKIGDMVEINAKIILTGTSSMHIAVDVYARNPRENKKRKTTHCILVMVAMKEGGKAQVPTWIPETENDLALENYAKKLMDLRTQIDDEMRPFIREH